MSSDDRARETRREIARTRDEMGRTLEQIHGKFNPTVLKEQALHEFRDAKETIKAEIKTELGQAKTAAYDATFGKVDHMVRSTTSTVRETIKANPIPVALAAVGLGWLYMNMRRSSSSQRRELSYDGAQRELPLGETKAKAQGVIESAQEKVGEAVDTAQEKLGQVGEKAGEMAGRAQQSIQRFAHDAGERGREVENRIEQTFHTSPLVFGLVAAAVGIGIGMAIPISRKENEWMGSTRDRLLDKVGDSAKHALDKGGEMATQAVDQVGGDHHDQTAQQQQPQGPDQGNQEQRLPH